jgi:hypothetical protein
MHIHLARLIPLFGPLVLPTPAGFLSRHGQVFTGVRPALTRSQISL